MARINPFAQENAKRNEENDTYAHGAEATKEAKVIKQEPKATPEEKPEIKPAAKPEVENKKPTDLTVEAKEKAPSNNENKSKSVKTRAVDSKVTINNSDKNYTGQLKSYAIQLLPEDDEYLQFKAAQSGLKMKDLFATILINEIASVNSNQVTFNDDKVKEFAKIHSGKVRRTTSVPEDMITDIKKAAMSLRINPSGFVAYAINKAHASDAEWID